MASVFAPRRTVTSRLHAPWRALKRGLPLLGLLSGNTTACFTTCDGGYAPWDSGWSRIQISGTVNSHVPGTYPITYSLTDLAGHTTTRTRTVSVLAR
ncbi:DUF5011 domain-containing protein [Cystobacter fuscus]|uniref:immunoglobulin-like domain-containing protein n=1 Tax=Cystobacter fuscus TaxID=43 RepID=UPI002B2C1D5D|nr:DUF5011 domain-containing protein [Cystobacter fuscus]